MHYYKRNIGDYAKKAARLTILQHGVYNLLLDACYDRERFPTREEAVDWVWASSSEEEQAVDFVLRKFFTLDHETGIYMQTRIAEEIQAYRLFCDSQAENGKKGGRPRKPKTPEEKPNGFSDEPSGKPPEPEETLTTNHKPLTNNHADSGESGAEAPKPKRGLDFSGWPDQPSEQVRKDWIALRKQAKAPASQTVVDQFAKEIAKAVDHGYSADDCLSLAILKGWRGFKYEWMQNEYRGQPRGSPGGAGIIERATDRSWADS